MAVSEATKNKIDALAIVAIAASSLFITVGGYVINQHGERLDAKDARISALEIQQATINEHVDAHDFSANHWIEVIKQLQAASYALQVRVSQLETKPKARADPFTGTDGNRLERMIKLLEQKLGKMND